MQITFAGGSGSEPARLLEMRLSGPLLVMSLWRHGAQVMSAISASGLWSIIDDALPAGVFDLPADAHDARIFIQGGGYWSIAGASLRLFEPLNAIVGQGPAPARRWLVPLTALHEIRPRNPQEKFLPTFAPGGHELWPELGHKEETAR
jgi:hypothetical protein